MKTKEDWIEFFEQFDNGTFVAFADAERGNFYSGDDLETSFCPDNNIHYVDLKNSIEVLGGRLVNDIERSEEHWKSS